MSANPRNSPRIVVISSPFARKRAADRQPPRVNEAFRSRATRVLTRRFPNGPVWLPGDRHLRGIAPGRHACLVDASKAIRGQGSPLILGSWMNGRQQPPALQPATHRAEPSRRDGENFTMKQRLHLAGWHRAMIVSADASSFPTTRRSADEGRIAQRQGPNSRHRDLQRPSELGPRGDRCPSNSEELVCRWSEAAELFAKTRPPRSSGSPAPVPAVRTRERGGAAAKQEQAKDGLSQDRCSRAGSADIPDQGAAPISVMR
jgi:hypothetical protein